MSRDQKDFPECLRTTYSDVSQELLCRELDRMEIIKNILEIEILARFWPGVIELYFLNMVELSNFEKIAFPQNLKVNPCPADPGVN